ncbi:sigma-54 interaction domain-containing protein [Salibacterium sp. K-3]
MHAQSQLLVLTDQEENILEVKGEEKDVFRCSKPILTAGHTLRNIKWHEVLTDTLHFDHSFQSLETINGETIYVCRYELHSNPYTIYLFHNFSPGLKEEETDFIVQSPAMTRILTIINNVSDVDSTVLLLGESGVGKSAAAELIHKKSSRRNGPFLTVNCGALPENLIESELFGYEPGAFTGGRSKGKEGLFEAARGGTIFLDEIAELPYFMQSKLLDVVQENKIRKVGGIREREINVRIVAATNKNLTRLVEKGAFREDLYYRLNVVPLTLPPLRERKEDIPQLVTQLVDMFNQKYGRSVSVPDGVKEQFLERRWPGNIRELANTIERMIVTNGTFLQENSGSESPGYDTETEEHSYPSLKEVKEKAEKELILKVYRTYENTYKTAKALGVDQSTISKKIKKYIQSE